MRKPDTARHSRQLRTSIDSRRPFDAQLLATLAEIQRKEHISEGRAVMRLLWLGWQAFYGPQVASEAALPEEDTRDVPGGRSLRTAPKPVIRPPAVLDPQAHGKGEPRDIGEVPSMEELSVSLDGRAVRENLTVDRPSPQTVPFSADPMPSSANALVRFRTMVLSRSVAPPEVAVLREDGQAIEAQTLPAAHLASTLARLQGEERSVE